MSMRRKARSSGRTPDHGTLEDESFLRPVWDITSITQRDIASSTAG